MKTMTPKDPNNASQERFGNASEEITDASDDSRAELVAYLDGELTPERAAAIESELASNSKLRQEARRLQETWDMLDVLPKNEASQSFTETTMALAKGMVDQPTQSWMGRRWQWIMLVLACIATIGISQYATQDALDFQNRELVEKLPLIENFDDFAAIDSIEFLNVLDKENLFDASDADSIQPVDFRKTTASQWRKQLDKMTVDQLRNLKEKKSRFDKADAQTKQHVAEIFDKLGTYKDYRRREFLITKYRKWLQQIDPDARKEIESAPLDRKIKLIRIAKSVQFGEAELSRKELEKLIWWATELYDSKKDIWVSLVFSPEQISFFEKMGLRERIQTLAGKTHFLASINQLETKHHLQTLLLTESDFKSFESALSPDTLAEFQQYKSFDDKFLRVFELLKKTALATKPPAERLQEFFDEKLTPLEQKRMIEKEQKVREAELIRRYKWEMNQKDSKNSLDAQQ